MDRVASGNIAGIGVAALLICAGIIVYLFFIGRPPSAPGEASGAALLERYRRQGATEKDYGEWQNALDVSLSSTNRPRRTCRGRPPATRSEPVDSFAVNEATLLLSLLAANLLHAARVLGRGARAALMSRETFRTRLLKTSARVARSSRYVTLWISAAQADGWQRLGQALAALPPVRGSPTLQALPSPA